MWPPSTPGAGVCTTIVLVATPPGSSAPSTWQMYSWNPWISLISQGPRDDVADLMVDCCSSDPETPPCVRTSFCGWPPLFTIATLEVMSSPHVAGSGESVIDCGTTGAGPCALASAPVPATV